LQHSLGHDGRTRRKIESAPHHLFRCRCAVIRCCIGITGFAFAHIGEIGAEFGTTTGRKRRCGWFDGVIGRYAVRINGLDCLAVTKLDVLDDLEEIKVCTAYELDGQVVRDFPSDARAFARAVPIYETLAGWQQSTSECKNVEDLPEAAKTYLKFLADLMEIPIAIISLGASRGQTIIVEDPIHGPKRGLLRN
jgi:adenylosuccinate synthase